MRTVYVASRAFPKYATMWQRFRDELDKSDIEVTATWIDEAGPGETPDMGLLWERIIDQETHVAAVVLYVEAEDLPIKGALVEVGAALARDARVHVVAPGCTDKDLGSWVRHPNVTRHADISGALVALEAME